MIYTKKLFRKKVVYWILRNRLMTGQYKDQSPFDRTSSSIH